MSELPSISTSAYASNAVGWGVNAVGGLGLIDVQQNNEWLKRTLLATPYTSTLSQKQETTVMAVTRRIVRIFIVDPNDNLPVEDSFIYAGDELKTELTDQELFFTIDINSMLKAHNEKRIKVLDKAVKDRAEYLEPARIRDLKMVVTVVAQF